MDPALQALLLRLDRLPGGFTEIQEGVRKAVLVADLDPEMALTRSRKVLELVIREVYERCCQEPPGTRPLENLLQRLIKDGHIPARLDAYANAVRLLGNVGTHRFGERLTVADVHQSLSQLMPILEWYTGAAAPHGVAPQREGTGNTPATAMPGRPDTRPAVVPKGLRSFDAGDARFFLDLLPGPRDDRGLPDSIRFWKQPSKPRKS